MRRVPSHHSVLMAGHARAGIEFLSEIFDLRVDRIGA